MSPKTQALIKAMRSEDLTFEELALAVEALEALSTQLGGYFADENSQQYMASIIVNYRLLAMAVKAGVR